MVPHNWIENEDDAATFVDVVVEEKHCSLANDGSHASCTVMDDEMPWTSSGWEMMESMADWSNQHRVDDDGLMGDSVEAWADE